MSEVTIAEVRALVTTSLLDGDLQDLIDREEAWLARRIGPLTGDRTETFLIHSSGGYSILRLQRPTTEVEVEDNGIAETDVELRRYGWRVARTDAGFWNGPRVEVTYEPNDLDEVRRVLFNLIRLGLITVGTSADSDAYESEKIGEYAYKKATGALSPVAIRSAAARSLLAPREPDSIRLLSSIAVDIRNSTAADPLPV